MYLKPLLSLTLRNSINKRAGIAQLVERNLAKTMRYKKNPLDTV